MNISALQSREADIARIMLQMYPDTPAQNILAAANHVKQVSELALACITRQAEEKPGQTER